LKLDLKIFFTLIILFSFLVSEKITRRKRRIKVAKKIRNKVPNN
jgi:hypothetical protein